jgi:uncharacterized protein
MRTGECDILIIPGWSGSGPDHWQSRWARGFKTARLVEQTDWVKADRDAWVERIVAEAATCTRPILIVAHSLGVVAAVHALNHGVTAAGAFLVAPADTANAHAWPVTQGHTFEGATSGFTAVPETRLSCPSALVSSANDPYCSLERARALSEAWGSRLFEAGDVGHLNVESGHGPWPDGLMQLGWFLRTLEP